MTRRVTEGESRQSPSAIVWTAAGAVPGGVRQRLLQDAVGGLVGGGADRAGHARAGDGDAQSCRSVLGEEGAERGEAGRGVDDTSRGVDGPQSADELVDVGGRLAGDVLDRRQRRAGALGLAIVAKPRRSGAYRDHVERVAGGVVQVAGDAGALLGDRELPLARGLLFGEDGALAEFGHLLAAQPGAFAREPRGDVGEAGVDQVAARQADGRHARTEICDEQDHHDAGVARRPRRRVVAAAGEQVQRRRRSQRRPDHDAVRGQQDARRRGQREDTQR